MLPSVAAPLPCVLWDTSRTLRNSSGCRPGGVTRGCTSTRSAQPLVDCHGGSLRQDAHARPLAHAAAEAYEVVVAHPDVAVGRRVLEPLLLQHAGAALDREAVAVERRRIESEAEAA